MYKAILLFLLLLIATGLQAADQTAWDRNARQRWSIVQLGLLPGEPTATRHSSTYGVKVGAPICGLFVYVTTVGIFLFFVLFLCEFFYPLTACEKHHRE